MAIAIKSIPVLKDKAAELFQRNIEDNSRRRASIDFKKQMKNTAKILQKSKIK